jgi:hypothetical protein
MLINDGIFKLKIYVYDVFMDEAYFHITNILYVGKDYIYDNDESCDGEERKHYYKDFNKEWFLDKKSLIDYINNNEEVDQIINDDKD